MASRKGSRLLNFAFPYQFQWTSRQDEKIELFQSERNTGNLLTNFATGMASPGKGGESPKFSLAVLRRVWWHAQNVRNINDNKEKNIPKRVFNFHLKILAVILILIISWIKWWSLILTVIQINDDFKRIIHLLSLSSPI